MQSICFRMFIWL